MNELSYLLYGFFILSIISGIIILLMKNKLFGAYFFIVKIEY